MAEVDYYFKIEFRSRNNKFSSRENDIKHLATYGFFINYCNMTSANSDEFHELGNIYLDLQQRSEFYEFYSETDLQMCKLVDSINEELARQNIYYIRIINSCGKYNYLESRCKFKEGVFLHIRCKVLNWEEYVLNNKYRKELVKICNKLIKNIFNKKLVKLGLSEISRINPKPYYMHYCYNKRAKSI